MLGRARKLLALVSVRADNLSDVWLHELHEPEPRARRQNHLAARRPASRSQCGHTLAAAGAIEATATRTRLPATAGDGRALRAVHSRAVEPYAKIAGALVTASCVALVVVRAATAPAPPPLPRATAEQRAMFASSIASQEDEWRNRAADDFPADSWSQRDAFHAHEAAAVSGLAASSRVSYEDVFRAVDDDIHRSRGSGRDRSANAVPCKPRPVFD